jgi:hypothetical protein
MISSQLSALACCLSESDIELIILQGLSMHMIYKSPGLRPMGDMDILVDPQKKDALIKLLKSHGYQTPNPLFPDNQYKNGVWLDIHTHVLNLDRIKTRSFVFPIDMTYFRKRASPHPDHPHILIPSSCDNLVALCAHALKHSYSKLIWIADIHELLLTILEKPDGWKNVVHHSKYWKQEKVVLYALLISEHMFGLMVPTSVKKELGITQMGAIEKYFIRKRLKGITSLEFGNILWVFIIKGLGKKSGFILETLFPRKEILDQIFSGNKKKYFLIQRVIQIMMQIVSQVRKMR